MMHRVTQRLLATRLGVNYNTLRSYINRHFSLWDRNFGIPEWIARQVSEHYLPKEITLSQYSTPNMVDCTECSKAKTCLYGKLIVIPKQGGCAKGELLPILFHPMWCK